MSLDPKRFEFGEYILDSREKVLLRNGRSVQIPPKVLELLVVLVENHGHVVEKELLMEKLWAGTFVEESNLTFSIRKLRKILGDDTHSPTFIETLPKRGYRFIATVGTNGAEETGASAAVSLRDIDRPAQPGGLPSRRRFLWIAILVLAVGGVGMAYLLNKSPIRDPQDWTQAQNLQLTDQSGTEFYPSLAPDGRSVVFAAETDGNNDIFSLRIGGQNPVNLTPGSPSDDVQPAFSPDGESIAFRSEREPAGIYLMGATGENPRRVSDVGFNPTWSPDGKEIAVAERSQDIPSVRNPSSLWIVNVETGAKHRLVENSAMQPSWSPNGRRIAFWYTENRGKRIIATVAAAGGEPVVVTDVGNANWNPVWSPDGEFLYFASDRGGNMAFWRVRVDPDSGATQAEPEFVPTPANFSRHLSFSRDGRRLAYVQTTITSNLKSVAFDPASEKILGEPEWVTRGDREISGPDLSPDGKQFAARVIRRTQDDIVLLNADGSNQRDLTNDDPFDRYVRWSPDGRRVAFASDRSGNYQIWTIDSDGSNLTQITFMDDRVVSFPVWSPDGSKLIFDAGTRAYILDMNKGWNEQTPVEVPLMSDGRFFRIWDWSPDGKKLAGFIERNGGIGSYSFETGTFQTLTDYNSIPRWLPDNRRIVFVNDGRAMLGDVQTGSVREFLPQIKDQLRNITVSPDGKLLYYTAVSSESDIWLMDLTKEKQ